MDLNKFYRDMETIVHQILEEKNLLTSPWRLGTIDEVVSSIRVKVKVDGGSVAQALPCNPDVQFRAGDKVWVIRINQNDKFVLCKRAIQ